MKYSKPEVSVLGEVGTIIRGIPKGMPGILDSADGLRDFNAAYDLDE